MHPDDDQHLTCPLCGQLHTAPRLAPGRRATCVRCGTLLAEAGRLGPHASAAFAVAGLALALPSLLLPFVTLSKFGRERAVLLTDSFQGFWAQSYEPFGAAVLACGTLAPFALLALLLAVHAAGRHQPPGVWRRILARCAHQVEYWAMPEVQILGVLVAFFKLGAVVDVRVGPGLWCYGAASLFTLLAWRSFKLRPRERKAARGPAAATP